MCEKKRVSPWRRNLLATKPRNGTELGQVNSAVEELPGLRGKDERPMYHKGESDSLLYVHWMEAVVRRKTRTVEVSS